MADYVRRTENTYVSHHYVAKLWRENGLKPHDYDALVAVVCGAGGHIGDWTGGEDFSAGRIVAAASRELYEEAVSLLED